MQSLIVQRSVVRSYGRNQAIVNEGDATKGMNCVLKGRVRAVRFAKNGEEVLLTRLKDMLDTRQLEHTTNAGADEIRVSQSDLATMVGVSRQTLSGLLARLEAKGRIEIGYRRIRLLP